MGLDGLDVRPLGLLCLSRRHAAYCLADYCAPITVH